jgi:hypothetical protein
MKKILVALTPNGDEILRTALGTGQYQYVSCPTFLGAQRAILDTDLDLIICGLRFSEIRMFDLLRYVRAHRRVDHIPFACIRTTMSANMAENRMAYFRGIELAARAYGAERFINYLDWQSRYGAGVAQQMLRDAVNRLLSIDDDSALIDALNAAMRD